MAAHFISQHIIILQLILTHSLILKSRKRQIVSHVRNKWTCIHTSVLLCSHRVSTVDPFRKECLTCSLFKSKCSFYDAILSPNYQHVVLNCRGNASLWQQHHNWAAHDQIEAAASFPNLILLFRSCCSPTFHTFFGLRGLYLDLSGVPSWVIVSILIFNASWNIKNNGDYMLKNSPFTCFLIILRVSLVVFKLFPASSQAHTFHPQMFVNDRGGN